MECIEWNTLRKIYLTNEGYLQISVKFTDIDHDIMCYTINRKTRINKSKNNLISLKIQSRSRKAKRNPQKVEKIAKNSKNKINKI